MPTNVIMPALEMAQETGKVIRWLKPPGATVSPAAFPDVTLALAEIFA